MSTHITPVVAYIKEIHIGLAAGDLVHICALVGVRGYPGIWSNVTLVREVHGGRVRGVPMGLNDWWMAPGIHVAHMSAI